MRGERCKGVNMSVAMLKKLAVIIEKKDDGLFSYPVTKQKKYIRQFNSPKDEFERSYFQYCCQMKLYRPLLRIMLNIAALPLSVFYLVKYKRNRINSTDKHKCIFVKNGLPENIVPTSLKQGEREIVAVEIVENVLNKGDMTFLRNLFKRYPFSWMLWLKTIIKTSQYSAIITKHSPEVLISCDEFSFTSSIMTKYCRQNGIKRINVMHGEKLYFMRDSFVDYDEYYVWDQYYVDLLVELGARKEQFRVELPESMVIKKRGDVCICYDYTYYLAAESKDTLQVISNTLRTLYDKGKRVSIRPHPRYSDMKLVNEMFDFANIEDYRSVTIEQSLLQTDTAISLFSTVLNQSVSNSIPIVIDDLSNRKHFEKLKELKYVVLNKEHMLLSEIIGELE